MKERCKISVIVPVYNTEKFLNRCIESILNQTYDNLEIILINDGSTDNSLEICEELSHKDNRIILINQENKGVSYSRNEGIKRANGEYIAFVDSDDYIEKDYLETLFNETDNQKVDMVISGYTKVLENKSLKEIRDSNCILCDKKLFEENFTRLKKENLINIQCNKLTRATIIKNNKEDERLICAEDYFFNLDVLKECSSIKISSCCGYIYEDNKNGTTNSIRRKYTEYYELNKQLMVIKIEEEKLLNLGFSKELVNEMMNEKYFIAIKRVARNIAFIKSNKREKKKKYKELFKNLVLKERIKLKYVSSINEFISYAVFKSQNIILLKIYSNMLKMKSSLKG